MKPAELLSIQEHQALALSGLIQSTAQVNMLARHGQWSEPNARTCIHSLFQLDSASVIDVYGDIASLRSGLVHLKNLLLKQVDSSDIDVTRYAVTLLHLEQKLKKQSGILDLVRQKLLELKSEHDISRIEDPYLIRRIAEIYSETISTIPPRVQVEGDRQYLTLEYNANRVRAMLFCGMRSAVLWRQVGGSRWKLFFQRSRMLKATEHLLEA